MAAMNNPVRRLLVLLLLAAAGGAFWTWWRERVGQSEPNETPTWPPLDEPVAEPAPAAAARATATPPEPTAPAVVAETTGSPEATGNGEQATWLPPNADGTCHEGYPIKANDNSGIFHLPSGRFYDRTKAERCYPSPAAALADGYRQAKS